MMQVIEMSHQEKVEMYQLRSKEELIEMLIQANNVIKEFVKPTVVNLDEVNQVEIPEEESLFVNGLDKYFEDMEKWENSFYCNECGQDDKSFFIYNRTCSNCDVYTCKNCNSETTVEHKPNEDNY